MKKSETSVAEDEADRGVYSLRNKYFARTYVASEFQNLREEIGSIETLKRRLLTEDHISCAYQLRNGDWREAVFWRMELAAGEVSKVIYYSQDLDTAMAKRMEERQELTDEFQMIAGLREDGSIACYHFNYCYEQNNKIKIVLAIKDISDIVEWATGKFELLQHRT